MKTPLLFGILSLILSLFISSCSVNQQIYLNPDGSGNVTSSVFLEGFFLTTLQDLTDLNSPGADGRERLAPLSIKSEMEQNPHFSKISIESPGEGKYRGNLSFNHVEEIFSLPGVTPAENILKLKEITPGVYQLKIKINNTNFQQIFQLFPMLQNPGFQYFLPEAGITEAEYKEMLFFIFEGAEGMDERTIKSLINTAALELVIQVNGSIIDQYGGQMINSSTMRISLPLVKLLMHKEEINYSLTFRSR